MPPSLASTTIGAGVQPVPSPTLPDSSSAVRRAWLRKGSASPASESHWPPSSAAMPGAMRAITWDSRSAIIFPNSGVGVNLGLPPLAGAAHGPTVDRHPPARALDPRLAERGDLDGNEVWVRQPHRPGAFPRAEVIFDDEAPPYVREVGLDEAREAGVEAHDPERAGI